MLTPSTLDFGPSGGEGEGVGEADTEDFGLWGSNVDGSNPRSLVTRTENLLAFFALRSSPSHKVDRTPIARMRRVAEMMPM
jgi:hypothetical protein